ncbi:MAG: hypothetical protein GX663_04655 [Clostridiales bacterium]|nr:hypothetical protein [Clostridiales bacterium]
MKRIGVFVCLMIMVVSVLAPACFAANENDSTTATKGNFNIVSSTPQNGADGVSVENLSVKLYFSTDMLPDSDSKAIREANAKQFKLTNSKGKKIPIKVYYSHKEKGLMMVVSDIVGKDIKIEGATDYKLTIGGNLQASDGSKLGSKENISFKTLDQSKSTTVYMVMMGVMIVGMIFFTTRSAKKAAEKERQGTGKTETVNPYKEAKKTGKSVEEIVKRDEQRKIKEAELAAKKRAKDAEYDALIAEEKKKALNKRVSSAKPISKAGSTYKVKVKKSTSKATEKKNTTNPKNQTGKQKNSKKKSTKK